jgi:peptide-methionine (R)-S-oxide reductase
LTFDGSLKRLGTREYQKNASTEYAMPKSPRPNATPPAVQKSDAEWKRALTPEQYRVLRGHGTERAGTSPLNDEHRAGTFRCAGCGQPLFESDAKFASGTGWPSFNRPLAGAVSTSRDEAYNMQRTEVHCSSCHGHLGHVFVDGPRPTGERYCMNGVALSFEPEGKARKPRSGA